MVTRVCAPAAELLPLELCEGQVLVGRSGGSGRGAWLAVEKAAFDGLESRHLSRAFRREVRDFDRAAFRKSVRTLAQRRVYETLGLARRQGTLQLGIDAISAPCDGLPSRQRGERDGIAICVSDLTKRSARRVDAHVFGTGADLGQALGTGWVGAAEIRPSRGAGDAAYWLRVWYVAADAADAYSPGTRAGAGVGEGDTSSSESESKAVPSDSDTDVGTVGTLRKVAG